MVSGLVLFTVMMLFPSQSIRKSRSDMVAPHIVDELELGGRDIAQDVEHRAVAAHGRLEALDVVGACRAVDLDGGADVAETRADAVFNGEEATQIETALDLDGDVVQRDAEGLGIEAVGDLLAGAERGQDQFDGVRPRIPAAECRGLIECEAEIADRRLAAKPRQLTGRCGEGRRCVARILPQAALGVGEDVLEIGRHRALHWSLSCGATRWLRRFSGWSRGASCPSNPAGPLRSGGSGR